MEACRPCLSSSAPVPQEELRMPDELSVPQVRPVREARGLPSPRESQRVCRRLRGKLRGRHGVLWDEKMLFKWMWAHLPGAQDAVQR